jgi:very-short-patch-repair endonuclease
MKRLFNNKTIKEKRRELRRNQTDAEKKLWNMVRSRQVCGLKFFRQYSVGSYILDFYCPTKHLAIELDGGQHADSSYDNERTTYLNRKGIRVLRFWNNEVFANSAGVYERIIDTIS